MFPGLRDKLTKGKRFATILFSLGVLVPEVEKFEDKGILDGFFDGHHVRFWCICGA
jgi:hypothetical protein